MQKEIVIPQADFDDIVEKIKKKNNNVTLSIRIGREYYDKLQEIAEINKISANELARAAIEYFIDHR